MDSEELDDELLDDELLDSELLEEDEDDDRDELEELLEESASITGAPTPAPGNQRCMAGRRLGRGRMRRISQA